MTSRDERTMESSTGDSHTGKSASTSSAAAPLVADGLTASNRLLLDKQKYIENYDFPYCEESNKYEPLKKIGQGTFGEVFKARDRQMHSKLVALKKVLMDNEKEGVRHFIDFS